MNRQADFARAQPSRVFAAVGNFERNVAQRPLIRNRDRVVDVLERGCGDRDRSIPGTSATKAPIPSAGSADALRDCVIPFRYAAAISRRRDSPAFQARQARPPQKRRLQFVQPAVVPDKVMPILGGLPIVAQSPHARIKLRVARENRPSVAHRPQVLGRIKARRREVSRPPPSIERSLRPSASRCSSRSRRSAPGSSVNPYR